MIYKYENNYFNNLLYIIIYIIFIRYFLKYNYSVSWITGLGNGFKPRIVRS